MKPRTPNFEPRTLNKLTSARAFRVQGSRFKVLSFAFLCLLAGFPLRLLAANVGGTINANTTWTFANSPYVVTSSVTVASNVTLTIEPGVSVLFSNGLGMTIRGRLLAEGTPTDRIRFTRNPAATSWTRLDFTASPLESRLAYADIEYAASSGNIRGTGARLRLDHLVWTNTTAQLLNVTDTSITLLNSVLPTISGAEPVHGDGVPANGHAIFQSNIFGSTTGLNDIIDFTGGQRPGPILQVRDNVFTGASDDVLDLDGTDAHVEGNIFMNVHAGQGPGAADTSSAVSGGSDSGDTSRIVITRNLFYDCDHGILAKLGNFYVVQNNTFVNIQQAAMNFNEPLRNGVTAGRGVIFEGNIVWNSPTNFQNVYVNDPVNGTTALFVTRNILSGADHTNGLGNLALDPLLVGTNGVTAENIRALFALQTNSPALGAGPNGLDLGALVPTGATLSGEPPAITTNDWAVLTVGGPGIVGYHWRLDNGPWSSNLAQLTNSLSFTTNLFVNAEPIVLSNLAPGPHFVSVLGLDSAGVLQDSNTPTLSKTWTHVPVALLDTDHDGLPDLWEQAHGLDYQNPDDAALDGDEDGFTNFQEFLAGTAPDDRDSGLRLDPDGAGSAGPQMRFTAVAGHDYTIQYRTDLVAGSWVKLLDLLPRQTNTLLRVVDTNGSLIEPRFYRLVTPAQP